MFCPLKKKKSIHDEKKRTTESVGRRAGHVLSFPPPTMSPTMSPTTFLKARFNESGSQADCGDDEFFGEITATGYWSLVTVNFVPVASGGGTESGCLPNAEIFIFIADEQESYTLKVDGAIIKAGDNTSSVESVIFGTTDNCVLVKQSSTKSDNVANNALLHVTGNAIGDGDSSFAITKQESSPWWEVEFPFTAFAGSKVMISSAPGEASLEDFNVRFFDENSMEMFSYWFSEAVDVGSPLEITLPTTGATKMLIQMSPGKDRVLALKKVDFSSIDFSTLVIGGPDLSSATLSFPKCDGEAASASPSKTPKDDFGPKDGRKKVFCK